MDPVNDNNPVPLYRADALHAFPEWVTKEAMVSPANVAHLHQSAFADPVRREFPIHTKVATFLSYAYAMGAGDVDEVVVKNIEKAASAWGIADELAPYAALLDESTKEASAPQPFALVVERDSGPTGYFPCGDAHDTDASIRGICRSFGDSRWNAELTGAQIKQAATKLVEAADRQGVDVPGILRDLHDRTPDAASAVKFASIRQFMTGCDDETAGLYKEAAAAVTDGDVDQCLDVWLELDRACGVKYSKTHTPSPWHAFYAGVSEADIEKVAAANVFIGAAPVPAMILAGVRADDIDAAFAGDDRTIVKAACAHAATNAMAASQELTKLNALSAGRLSALLLARC